MAQITITKILDGPRNGAFHIAIEGDGSGELTDTVLIDPETSFDPTLPGVPTLTIDQLWYDLSGFDAKLEFDYLVSDTLIWAMSGGQSNTMDFCTFGGLKDRSAMDGQGKLKLSTRGLGAGDCGVMVVKVRKD